MLELHTLICFLTGEGNTAAEIHRELVQMYRENCIDVSILRRWKRDVKNKCYVVSLEDEQCSWRPADSLTADNIYHT